MLAKLNMITVHQHINQHIFTEDVNAHRGQRFTCPAGFFAKIDQTIVGGDGNDAVAMGVVQINATHSDCQIGVVLDVLAQHGPVIHQINMIAGQHEHVFFTLLLHKIKITAHRIRRTQLPVAIGPAPVGLKQPHTTAGPIQIPRLTDADVIIQAARAILGKHSNIINFAIDAIAQGEVDQAEFAAKGRRRLGARFGQNA